MKKIYIALVCLLPMLAFAQPTIQQSDLPHAGIAWKTGVNKNYTGSITAGGANQTWDYSSLTYVTIDTTAFLSVTGTPYTSTFTTSNCVTYDYTTGNYQYFTNSSTGFYFDGGNSAGSPTIHLTPPQLYFPVPFTYNNTRQNDARFVFDTVQSGIPIRYILNIGTSVLADGWGQLILPSGTYNNTLRDRITNLEIDTVLADFTHTGNYTFYQRSLSQKVSYLWVRNGVAGSTYLLGIDADSIGVTVNRSEYYISSVVLSTNDLSANNNSLHVYPNPASSGVHFDLEGMRNQDAILKVFNSLGEEVISSEVKGVSYFDLPVDKFSNGIYYYSIISDNDKRSGKFCVAH